MKTMKFATFTIACLIMLSASAGPAPWHVWKSTWDGKTFCAQTSPGEGWEKHSGPYKDARCEQPGAKVNPA